MASFAMPQGVTVEQMLEAMGAPAAEPAAESAAESKPAAPARRKTEAPAKS